MSDELNDLTIVIPSRVRMRVEELEGPWRVGWLRTWRRIQQRAIRWILLLVLSAGAVLVNLLFLETLRLTFLVWMLLLLIGLSQARSAQLGMLSIISDSRAPRARWAVAQARTFNEALAAYRRHVRLLEGRGKRQASELLRRHVVDLSRRIEGELGILDASYRQNSGYVVEEDLSTLIEELATQRMEYDDFRQAVQLDLTMMRSGKSRFRS